MNIELIFLEANLALAAYAKDLNSGIPDIDKLVDGGVGMSTAQATRFAATYDVVDQYTDSVTGVSATIFRIIKGARLELNPI